MQEAERVAPPRLLRAVAVLVPVVLVVLLKVHTSGLVVLQVSGGAGQGSVMGDTVKVSTAVAVIGTVPPLFTVIEFPAWPWPPIWR